MQSSSELHFTRLKLLIWKAFFLDISAWTPRLQIVASVCWPIVVFDERTFFRQQQQSFTFCVLKIKKPLWLYVSKNLMMEVDESKIDEHELFLLEHLHVWPRICFVIARGEPNSNRKTKPNKGTRTARFSRAGQWQRQKKKSVESRGGANWALHRFRCTQKQKDN